MKQNLLLLGTLKPKGILNGETQIAPRREGVLVKVKASIIPPYVGGAKEMCHMKKLSIEFKTNIGKNIQPIMLKQLLNLPSLYSILKLSVKLRGSKLSYIKYRMVSKESLHMPLEVCIKVK